MAGELARERGRLVLAQYHQDGTRQVNMQLWNWRGLHVANAHERDPPLASRPRLGFLGVGWIGRHRMEAAARVSAGGRSVAGRGDVEDHARGSERRHREAPPPGTMPRVKEGVP